MTISRFIGAVLFLAACLFLAAPLLYAQSTVLSAPTAIRSTEVVGSIAARDIGDSRLTDHFYFFTGTPGDLLITVESRNLNGDIDVFTASGMRPLLKFTVYQGSGSATTKSIYLRKREDLILRVEARSPNDDEGIYRVRFGGSFEPISGGLDGQPLASESSSPDTLDTGGKASKKGRRVTSVGARIDEPAPAEVVAVPTPSPEAAEKPATSARTNPRNNRGRRPARGRTPPTTAEPGAEKSASEVTSKATPETTESTERATTGDPTPAEKPAARSPAGRRRAGRRNTPTRPAEVPAAPAVEESGPRLLIETSDGTMINRYMTSVRRVTVENGQVVVIGRDGKVERFQLAKILKMSVEQ